MPELIIPTRYAGLSEDEQALDRHVEWLTEQFDVNEDLRIIACGRKCDVVPENWRGVATPVFVAKQVKFMLDLVDAARTSLSGKDLPLIVNPFDELEMKRRSLCAAWTESYGIGLVVNVYDQQLKKAYREFCKQAMNTLLPRLHTLWKNDFDESLIERIEEAKAFDTDVVVKLDSVYFNKGREYFKGAEPFWKSLEKDQLGGFFVPTGEEVREAMEKY